VRWWRTPEALVALVDRTGATPLAFDGSVVEAGGAELLSGRGRVRAAEGGLLVEVDELADGPAAVRIPWAAGATG
jgi:hypothetical protein